MPKIFSILLMLLMPGLVMAEDDLKAWPAAEAGYNRYVIRLAPMDTEANHQVEIMVGKNMLVDCNQHRLGGDLEARVVKGWGYTSYHLEKVGGPMSTMMACPGQQKKTQFIRVSGDGYRVRYNSKLPIVVYVPEGFEVGYRIWSAPEQMQKAGIE
ncbi:MAG TPA: serine protease inhibitor ecotin [Gammaproteobacteria bacterium]